MYAALKSLPAGSIEDEIYSALSIAPNIHRASGLRQNSSQLDAMVLRGLIRLARRARPIYRSTAVSIKSNKGKRDDRFGCLRPTKCHVAALCPSRSFHTPFPTFSMQLTASIYIVTFSFRSVSHSKLPFHFPRPRVAANLFPFSQGTRIRVHVAALLSLFSSLCIRHLSALGALRATDDYPRRLAKRSFVSLCPSLLALNTVIRWHDRFHLEPRGHVPQREMEFRQRAMLAPTSSHENIKIQRDRHSVARWTRR